MLYTKKEREKIEKVREVFADYIRKSRYVDLLWSEKLGYILLRIDAERRDIVMEPVIMEDGETLCKELCLEIIQDVLEYTGNDHDRESIDALEKAEIKKRLRPYEERLPEYRIRIEDKTSSHA